LPVTTEKSIQVIPEPSDWVKSAAGHGGLQCRRRVRLALHLPADVRLDVPGPRSADVHDEEDHPVVRELDAGEGREGLGA
jgi:hypothetical protein